jgi:hypothetical protein
LFHLVFDSHNGRALGADSEEKHEPVSDINTTAVDGLKVLDPRRPIREADIRQIATSDKCCHERTWRSDSEVTGLGKYDVLVAVFNASHTQPRSTRMAAQNLSK